PSRTAHTRRQVHPRRAPSPERVPHVRHGQSKVLILMKNILVTGGAGYIGSHTAKLLASAGYRPITLDNLSTGHEWAVQWGPLVPGDLGDKDLLVRTLRDYEFDAVMHFAASAYVGDSVVHPRYYYQNNVANSLNLLDAI